MRSGLASLENLDLDGDPAWNNLATANMNANQYPTWLSFLIPILILLAVWDAVWKTVGMWRSARNNQLAWFICIAIFNTVGILPIVYLSFCQKNKNAQ
jgi:hypothetical protein